MRIRGSRRPDFVQKICKEGTCAQTYDNSMEGGLGQDDGMVTPLFGDVELGRMDRRDGTIAGQLGRTWSKKISKEKHVMEGGRKCTSRKNNDHWTEDEMIKLVNGVCKKGIGKWSRVKGDYFSTSIRTAVHLKDKWRNLVRACKAKNASKKKVNVQKATELVVRRFRHRILALEAKRLGVKEK